MVATADKQAAATVYKIVRTQGRDVCLLAPFMSCFLIMLRYGFFKSYLIKTRWHLSQAL